MVVSVVVTCLIGFLWSTLIARQRPLLFQAWPHLNFQMSGSECFTVIQALYKTQSRSIGSGKLWLKQNIYNHFKYFHCLLRNGCSTFHSHLQSTFYHCIQLMMHENRVSLKSTVRPFNDQLIQLSIFTLIWVTLWILAKLLFIFMSWSFSFGVGLEEEKTQQYW